jgi:BirA family transcriptional regulator, biotin operon repressor / biotin---[acetyl-CoA-carboxylase] ligase
MNEALRRERIVAELEALGVGGPVAIAEETESTNDDARAGAEAGAPHGAVFLADHQRAGRGRRGHRWHSPAGENLYLSLLLRPELSPERLAPLALVAGVAVAQVVDAALGRPLAARLKWPNDVLVDGGKIAGVLVESALSAGRRPVCVVGVGLNVLTTAFPSDRSYGLAPTSLRLASAAELDREILAARLIATLRRLCDAYPAGGLAAVRADLDDRDALRGFAIEVDGLFGLGAGIDEGGRLVVEVEGRRQPIVSGAVRLR